MRQKVNVVGQLTRTQMSTPITHTDGQLNTFTPSTPLSNQYDYRMGRSFSYDPLGRMNASSATGFPYAYNPTYNEFGNVTGSSYLYWQSGSSNVQYSATFQNNKVTSSTDAGQTQTSNYDAMGNRTSLTKTVNGTTTTIESTSIDAVGRPASTQVFDGDGLSLAPGFTGFNLRSRALGGEILTQIDYLGVKKIGRVIDDDNLIAEQIIFTNSDTTVRWHHRDPLNLVARDTEPAQLKRKTFAINPIGAQIESTEGVNTTQYYACISGGQNTPSCSGFTPQPPGGYGSQADQANGAFAAGLKVDGALTLGSVSDALNQNTRSGYGTVYVSPALGGTALGQSFQHFTYEKFFNGPGKTKGEREKNGDTRIVDAWLFLPGAQDIATLITLTTQAIDVAQTVLGKKDSDCNKLLSTEGKGGITASELLKTLSKANAIAHSGRLDLVNEIAKSKAIDLARANGKDKAEYEYFVANAPGIGSGTKIELSLYFFASTSTNTQVTALGFRVLNILHELSHATGRYQHPDKDGNIDSKYKDKIKTDVLNQAIIDKCFANLDKQLSGALLTK